MNHAILITRTDWREPPRLRHQLALLLAGVGYHVAFIQKPTCLLPPSPPCLASESAIEGLTLLPARELLHHQLRFLPCLHHFNASVARRDLRECLASGDQASPELIINFNYDAFWLRSLFPDQPILTIINDDFEALGRLPMRRHLTWALKRTCSMSTRVLTVSEPLRQRLSQWCDPELFLPWAVNPYQVPSPSADRNVLLYWGYINERLDATSLKACVSELACLGLRLRFVGPINSHGRQLQSLLAASSTVEWLPACPFDALDTTDCFAALLPYRLDYIPNLAAQLPNKALQLLSLGLPLISTELPHLQRAPFVITYSSTSVSSLMAACRSALDGFLPLQPAIADFVAANGPEARLRQLLSGVA